MHLTPFPTGQVLMLAVSDPHHSRGLQCHLPTRDMGQSPIWPITDPKVHLLQPIRGLPQRSRRQAETIAESSCAVQYSNFQVTPKLVVLKAIVTNDQINVR